MLVNLTGTGPTTGTHLTAYGDGSLPNVSDPNLTTGETCPVLAVVPLDSNGYFSPRPPAACDASRHRASRKRTSLRRNGTGRPTHRP
ncbi:hypothetical protein [Streptomyces scabiei]|uniref:hypothetical protein n=1 Tax=Streptomyces scabiei TaxID=1930 RepID=UPI0029AC24C8|nr:hypothetical protein [Streptomyces scabiei]MDX3116126.1 hypothetical protein [Streptomyces scabiei]